MSKNKNKKFLSQNRIYSSSLKRKMNPKFISYNIRKKVNTINKERIHKNKDETFFRKNKKYKNIIRTNKKENEQKIMYDKNKLSMTFCDALKKFYWDFKTQRAVTSIFSQYQEFINKNFPNNKSKDLNVIKNIKNDQFFKENNIVSFLKSYKNFKNSTYNNRLGLFRLIIKIMTNNPFWDYINISFQENKTKNEKLFSLTEKYYL